MIRDDIIKMAIEARLPHYWESGDEIVYIERVEHFAKLVAQHEREACAEIAEKESMRGLPDEKPKGTHLKMAVAQITCGVFIAEAIRERGNP